MANKSQALQTGLTRAPRPRPRPIWRRVDVVEAATGYLFVLPFVASIGIFIFAAAVYVFYLSFTSFDLFSAPQWVGLKNYAKVLEEPIVRRALFNVTYYTVVVVPVQTFVAILLAVLLNRKMRGITLFRTAYFMPTVTSSVAASLLFMWLFLRQGVVNYVLSVLHLPSDIGWLENPATALPAVMILAIWGTVPQFMVIFLAALQDIPQSLYEAAQIDGAAGWKVFRHITLPLLRPATFLVVVLGAIGCFQVFDLMYVMTSGGPANATMTPVFLIYNSAFRDLLMGYAAALAMVLFVVILVATLLQRRLIDVNVQYNA